MKEWELDDAMTPNVIEEVVRYASDHNLLDRGAAVLAKDNILDICHERAVQEVADEENDERELKRLSGVLDGETSTSLSMSDGSKLPKLVALYQAGKINAATLALSGKCWDAMWEMPEEFTDDLPSVSQLMKIRLSYINKCGVGPLRKIFGGDLMEKV